MATKFPQPKKNSYVLPSSILLRGTTVRERFRGNARMKEERDIAHMPKRKTVKKKQFRFLM
jgi:hypothetical protein